jgi:hypothetical protein
MNTCLPTGVELSSVNAYVTVSWPDVPQKKPPDALRGTFVNAILLLVAMLLPVTLSPAPAPENVHGMPRHVTVAVTPETVVVAKTEWPVFALEDTVQVLELPVM